jgi:hypothetical protein
MRGKNKDDATGSISDRITKWMCAEIEGNQEIEGIQIAR